MCVDALKMNVEKKNEQTDFIAMKSEKKRRVRFNISWMLIREHS